MFPMPWGGENIIFARLTPNKTRVTILDKINKRVFPNVIDYNNQYFEIL